MLSLSTTKMIAIATTKMIAIATTKILMGSTIQKPTRRSNAVSLSILFDQGSKLLQVDPQFHFVFKYLTTGLERALGIAACEAMVREGPRSIPNPINK